MKTREINKKRRNHGFNWLLGSDVEVVYRYQWANWGGNDSFTTVHAKIKSPYKVQRESTKSKWANVVSFLQIASNAQDHRDH